MKPLFCGECELHCWMIGKLVAEISSWRRGESLLPTELLLCLLGAQRGHADQGNDPLLNHASGHFAVPQPVFSSGHTSARSP